MAFDYTELAALALEMMEEFGRVVSIVKIDRDPANAAKPWDGPGVGTNTTTPATVVFVDPVSEKDLGREELSDPDELGIKGRQIAFIAYSENPGIDFTTYERILDHSQTWKIDKANLLQPGGAPLLWALEVIR